MSEGGYTREDARHCVGTGWHGLLDEAYDAIGREPGVIVVQVKEKFGRLRIYTSPHSDAALDALMAIELRSAEVCEQCGAPGRTRNYGWLLTFCDPCAAAHEQQRSGHAS